VHYRCIRHMQRSCMKLTCISSSANQCVPLYVHAPAITKCQPPLMRWGVQCTERGLLWSWHLVGRLTWTALPESISCRYWHWSRNEKAPTPAPREVLDIIAFSVFVSCRE